MEGRPFTVLSKPVENPLCSSMNHMKNVGVYPTGKAFEVQTGCRDYSNAVKEIQRQTALCEGDIRVFTLPVLRGLVDA